LQEPSIPSNGGSPIANQGSFAEGGGATLRRLLRDQERERRLLALDLHDGLMQYLVGALLYLDELHDRPESLNPEALRPLDRARSLLRQAIVEGRRLIRGVRPPILDENGLADALKELVAETQAGSAIDVELQIETATSRYSPLLEGMVYRIVQEALTNIQRHSHSPRALVRLTDDGDGLRLDVRDWGVGFNLDEVGFDKCGLAGIRERCECLGGSCDISSTPGLGTWIVVRLPIFPSSPDIMEYRSA
jgi:signal transduction histidine kinase